MRRAPSVLFAVLLLAASLLAARASAQSEGTLRDRIESGQARAGQLSGAVARLGALETSLRADVTLLQGRVDAVQGELETAQERARQTAAALAEQRERAQRLRRRLAQVRTKLAALLRERYVSPAPDLVTVVLDSDGFHDLLEAMDFLRRVQRADTRLLDVVRDARADALRQRARLSVLSRRRDAEAAQVAQRRAALGGMLAGLHARQRALSAARAARQAALTRTRAGTAQAERALGRLERERAAAAAATRSAPTSSGPAPSGSGPAPSGPSASGPWAIPAAIVMCESGGQNLTPNGAGASGYYQFLPDTWRGLGGSTPQAYQASKAEQDRLAAKLWAGGAGAGNWVCASLVA